MPAVERRRAALVLARHDAAVAAPPGVDPVVFAAACLADTYEVLADLVGVSSGIVGPPATQDLLWPGGLWWPADTSLAALAGELTGRFDELVVVPADLPDLPGLVLAKMFKVLHRVELAVAPERSGRGCVAIGLSLPTQVELAALDLDRRPAGELAAAFTPDWHRLRAPADVRRLDPGLEGWEETRAVLTARPMTTG